MSFNTSAINREIYLPNLDHLHHTQIELKIKAKAVKVPLEGGGIISTTTQVSPPTDSKIHAQIHKSGGSGDGGDIIRLSSKRVVVNRLTLDWNHIFMISIYP